MNFAGIEYHGSETTTQRCLHAIARLYEGPGMLKCVRLLSADAVHGFLVSFECGRLVAIKAGFGSGYPGEGPRGLATALRFFDRLNVPLYEYLVGDSVIRRLNASALTKADIKNLEQAPPVPGQLWRDYTYRFDLKSHEQNTEFREQFSYDVPIRIIDTRILDLALELPANPDATLMNAYRRLEGILRQRCRLEGEHGTRLFAKAFQGKGALLYWPDIDPGEGEGRASLFIAVYRGFRNSRAHKEMQHSPDHFLREFLLLNELFRLEGTALRRA